MTYNIESMNLATTNLDAMVEFYAHVFGVVFERHEIAGGELYEGTFAGIPLVLIPAALVGIAATDNRMQLDIAVSDIRSVIEQVEGHGGRTNGKLVEDDEVRCFGVFDPDDNFIVFKEHK